MASEPQYFPNNGQYIPIPTSIYAQYYDYNKCPNPCRKYHISTDINGAEEVARLVLPYLLKREIFHKIVKTQGDLARQTAGVQAGKFITIYMNPEAEHKNSIILELGELLGVASKQGIIFPCPRIPMLRKYSNNPYFREMPIDNEFFIYGGFICDPTE
jgi:hypothetical protein